MTSESSWILLCLVLFSVGVTTRSMNDYYDLYDYDEALFQRSNTQQSVQESEEKNITLRMPDVHPEKHDSYFCTSLKMSDSDTYIVGYTPHAEMATAHHMLLFGCENPASKDKFWNCGDMGAGVCAPGSQEQIMYAWGRNAPVLKLPKDVAFQVGGSSVAKYLVLQVHYGHVDKFKNLSSVLAASTSHPSPSYSTKDTIITSSSNSLIGLQYTGTSIKQSRSVPSGRQKGLKKFKKDVEKGRVLLDGPKRYENDWPPPFHKTVIFMREWLVKQTGQDENWNHHQRQMLRTYFSKLYGLDSKKSGTGNIYLYFKVVFLSKRCWDLACSIMKKLEDGSLTIGKKKRAGRVFQSSFSCLTAIDPEKNEEAAFEILCKYEQGSLHSVNEIRENYGLNPTKKKVMTDASDNCQEMFENKRTEKDALELNEKLERKRNELEQSYLEKTTLSQDNQKLLNQLKDVSGERNKLLIRCSNFEKKINELEKELRNVKTDLLNFSKKQTIKEKENEQLRHDLQITKKRLQQVEQTANGISSTKPREQLRQLKDKSRSNADFLNKNHDLQRNSESEIQCKTDNFKSTTRENKNTGSKAGGKNQQLKNHQENPSLNDNSGVTIETTKKRTSFLAGITLLASGDSGFIPPKKTAWHLDVGCQYNNNPAIINPFAFRVHTHSLGTVVSGYRVRNGKWTLIGKNDPQLPQAFYPLKNAPKLKEGDYLATRCTYNSMSRKTTTHIGATMKDEMCNFYLMFYYDPSLTNLSPENSCSYMPENVLEHFPLDSDKPIPDSGQKMEMKRDFPEDELCLECKRSPQKMLTVQQSWPLGGSRDGELPFKSGQVSGVSMDSKGNVVIFHRGSRSWKEDTFNLIDNKLKAAYRAAPIPEDTVAWLDAETGKIKGRWGAGKFYLPHGITVDKHDNLWLTDVGMHQVFKYGPSGKALITLGTKLEPGSDLNHFCKPTGVAIDSDGNFFVSDGYCNERVLKYAPDGKVIMMITKAVFPALFSEPYNSFRIPHSVSIDNQRDQLYVADRENGRVLVFNSKTGMFVKSLTGFGSRVFAAHYNPADGGLLHVVNGFDYKTVVSGYTYSIADDKIIQTWKPTEGFTEPHDVTSNSKGDTVYVAEISPHRIWKFIKA